MECVICLRQLPEGTEVCPYCGTRFSLPAEKQLPAEKPRKRIPPALWWSAALLVLAVGSFIVFRMAVPACSPQTEKTVPTEQTRPTAEPEPHCHSFTEKLRTAPTCEEAGVLESVCDCGQIRVEPVEAVGHTYSGADCTRGGVCSVCGKAGGDALGHAVTDGVCTRCGHLQITLEDLQGTWVKWVLDGCISITVSGSGATVCESYLDDLTWYGSVQLTEDGFEITGTYTYYDAAGTAQTNGIRLHCPVKTLTRENIQEANFGGVWYRQA